MPEFKQSTVINAPVETVFRKVLDYEFLEQTLPAVRKAERTGDRTSRWTMEVAGREFESEVELARREENRLLVWRSISGPEFTDEIRFHDLGDGRTRVEYRGSYEPEGVLGALLSHAMHGVIESRMEEAAEQVKEAIERGA